MKRLTERDTNGTAMAACCGENCNHNFCCENGGYAECGDIDDIIDRLAAIEDILGDEYELDRLRELVEADREQEFQRHLKRFDIMPPKRRIPWKQESKADADVAPVRHAKWTHPHWCNDVSAANCSECGAEAQHREYRGVQKYYKVCPSCGAVMDLKEETEFGTAL